MRTLRPVPRAALVTALALTAATTAAGVAPAAASTPTLSITRTVTLAGTPVDGRFSTPVAAEAPEGGVYTVTRVAGKQTVWAVGRTSAPHVLATVTGIGAVTALAADPTFVYVGSATGISEYARATGAFVRRWRLSPSPRALSQLAVAGNRVWALLTPTGINRRPSSMVELDPSSSARVRTVNGLWDTVTIATTSSAVYYVTDHSRTIVRLTNAGVRTTAPTHQTVSALNGPAAVQVSVIRGNVLVLRFDAGQGTDAITIPYNLTTLAGPHRTGRFSAGAALVSTRIGLLDLTTPDDAACTARVHPCLRSYALGSVAVGTTLVLPYDSTSAPLGPWPATVALKGLTVRVLRFG